jgi:hypothetical protein
MTASAFILPLMLFGAGLGLVMPPLTNAMTTAVPLREVGMSSGLLNLVRNVGGAFGIAAFGTLLTNATNANVLSVAEHTVVHTTAPATLALVHSLVILKADVLAYGTVFAWSSLALVAGGVIAIFFLHVRGYGDEVPPETRAEAAAG